MLPPPGRSELTYYDELGVGPDATPEEIREAFRAMARLLHPDQQTDPALREMAERQMRKLNQINSVLSDPERRMAYDDALDRARSGPVLVISDSGSLKRSILRWVLAAVLVCGIMLGVWYMMDSGNTQEVRLQEPIPAQTNSPSASDVGDNVAQLKARIASLETERNTALQMLSKLTGTAGKTPATAAPPKAEPSADYAGTWSLGKGHGFASPGGESRYTPDFINLTVSGNGNSIRGDYKSRYQVLDHAVTPDVNFTFGGAPAKDGSFSWEGPGGAKGKVTLKTSGLGLEVSWIASEVGSQQWLTSGTATLSKN